MVTGLLRLASAQACRGHPVPYMEWILGRHKTVPRLLVREQHVILDTVAIGLHLAKASDCLISVDTDLTA